MKRWKNKTNFNQSCLRIIIMSSVWIWRSVFFVVFLSISHIPSCGWSLWKKMRIFHFLFSRLRGEKQKKWFYLLAAFNKTYEHIIFKWNSNIYASWHNSNVFCEFTMTFELCELDTMTASASTYICYAT